MRIRILRVGRGRVTSAEQPEEIDLPAGASLTTALRALSRTPDSQARLSPADLIVIRGEHVGSVGSHVDRDLRDGDDVTIISPVAGG